jgi:hypothetical protein
MKENNESRWDELLANNLIGKLVLVGLTYLDAQGELLNQQQFSGRITRANQASGILLRLEGNRLGEEYNLPPDTSSLRQASLGEYRLYSTEEIVLNPDFTVMYTIQRPAEVNLQLQPTIEN